MVNKTNKKFKKYFSVIWPWIIDILITFLYVFGMGVAIAMINSSAFWPQKGLIGNILAVYLYQYLNPDTMDSVLILIPYQFIEIAVFYCWYRRMVVIKTEIRTRLFQWKNIGLIVLLAIGNNLLISGAMDLLLPHLGKLGENYIDMMNNLFESNVILIFISSIILAPISEELIFRGVIMKKARDVFPFAVANVIQALLFGVMHGNIIQGSYAFVLGLSLGYVTYKFETILPAILIHCMLNLLGSYLLYSAPVFVQFLEVILGVGIIIYTVRTLSKIKPHESKLMD